jgi:nucleotide-binding universal stress UspA family protein
VITSHPLLVCTEGTESSDVALQAAADLASRGNARLVILAVVEAAPPMASEFAILPPMPDDSEARREALRGRASAQAESLIGEGTTWTVDVREGNVPRVIAAAGQELDARLIVTGLGRHDLVNRLFGAETTLEILRESPLPLFAVAPTYVQPPTRALIATDFSPASARAARVALELFDELTAVYLVHVAPRLDVQPEAFQQWMDLYGDDVGRAFDRVKAELRFPAGAAVETVTLQGKPSRELLDFAHSKGIGVIVTGSRGTGLLDRLFVGSTATGLIRGAECSVFCVPGPNENRESDAAPSNGG